jgi:gliding motility-associated-like protein
VASPSQVPTVPVVTATDNCTDSVGVTFTQTLVATGTNCDYIITRTWTALDACGNATRRTQQILVKAPPLDIKAVKTDETCLRNDGTITMIPSTGITYIWSDGARGAFRTGLKAGSYTVTATAGLCEKVLTVIILDGCTCQTPVIATIAKTDATCGNSNGSVTVTPDNAANYTFTWSANATGTGLSRSNLAAGFYTVTVTRTATPTCSTVLSVNVANNTANCCTQPIATITKVDAMCGDANGTATVSVDNAANYTFRWSFNGANLAGSSAQLTSLAVGTYSVTVARINNPTCSTVVTTTIANNTANCCVTPIATVTKVDATCGESNGSATIAVDIAANYTFTWSSNATAGTGASRSNLAAGTYTVTVSRINNATCSTVANVTILNNTANCCTTPIATVTKTDATCGGSNGSASIAVDVAANYTFTWSSNAPAGSGGSRSGLAAGTYSVTVSRTALPSCLTVATVTIANNTGNCCTPPLAVVTKTDATCSESNGTASVAVVDGVANYTFTWSANASTATGTGASRTNLAPGDYTITVSRVGNPTCLSIVTTTIANNTVGCCNIIFPTSIVKVLTDCAGTAEVCVEIAPARLTNYTITNNGAPYTGGFGTCLAGSTLNLPSGQHRLIFTNNLIANCKDTLDVKVACVREMSASRNIQLPATNDYCLTPAALGLTGTIVSVVNECAASADNSQITINSTTWCVSYKGLTVGLDTACLKITTSTGDIANMKLFINVTSAMPFNFINQDSVIITNACTDSTKVCVNIPFSMIGDYQVRLNGADYTGSVEGCLRDTVESYDFNLLTRNGAVGPYNLESWTVNGSTYSILNISSFQAIVDSMNRINPTGRWLLSGTSIAVSTGSGNTYSNMSFRTVSNGALTTIGLNTGVLYRGTNFMVQRGRTYLSFANRITGLADTLLVNAACITPQRIETTMLKGKTDTLCLDTRQLLGTRYRIAQIANGTGRFVQFGNILGTTCVNRAALNVGTEYVTYTLSDEYGMTDTVFVTTHVTESALLARRPYAVDDRANTTKAKAVYIDVMTNDSIFTNRGTITIIKEPKRGTAVVMPDFRILYTPNADYCNAAKPDTLTYTICNQAGCDTATVQVTVICDKIKVYSGFSPNNDGVNDFFVIEGAENFAKNTLTIYNRWGTAVLDTKGYKNDWGGNWDGKALPDGTYFYIFNDGEGNQISGYIQIQR